jgi:hypothetical protein
MNPNFTLENLRLLPLEITNLLVFGSVNEWNLTRLDARGVTYII